MVIGNIGDQAHFHKFFNVWKHLSHIKTKNANKKEIKNADYIIRSREDNGFYILAK